MAMSPEQPSAPRRSRIALWLVLLLLLALGGYAGWHQWRAREQAVVNSTQQQVDALSERLNAMRTEQRAQARRLQQADSLNRVLRDELDGITQRAALLETSVERLADPDRHGAQALRLDETEMLLTIGSQRLQIAGDLDGARRAYALAAGVLDGIDDPAYLSLRQTLLQERTALDALGADPRVRAIAQLDAYTQTVTAPAGREERARDERAPWWQRAFGNLLQVQPTDRAVAVQAADRAAALAGLQLEISLARAAAERRDTAGYRDALRRADTWLQRLAPDSAARTQQRAQLQALAALPLSLSVPTLGSTLQQLRQLRAR
ncbi:uroporphyrin-3 C-methyltransferase [Lysobacter niabensis]|uniref:Uroporphyrin-3 C-methyltransferase n=2 Tax=Agrilutibacter niabensis TaxID=380628 RepID=A0ABU1VSF8_9GAMM|nr:uroporphyrin-3 C-methyltransferase [Lysobacter niabensis]